MKPKARFLATKVLAAFLACVLCLTGTDANAFLFKGGIAAGGGGATLLTTMTLVNTSGSTQAADFVTDMMGHPFVKGQILNGCSGGAPQFQLTNGTNVPFSEELNPICWSDGSLKKASFLLRVPPSIAGSGSVTINILNGGSTPTPSSRALSDFATASTDLNVSVTGETLGNLSGVWVSNLNQGISAANTDNYVFMDGQAGKVWRIRASFRQAGVNHGQLEGYWYIQALQDSSGGLYGLRYLPRIAQPWYNCDAGGGGSGCDASAPAKNWRGFSAMTVNNGVSVLRDVFASRYGPTNAKTVTFAQSGNPACNVTPGNFPPANCSDLTATANGFDDANYVHLTNSGGSLPQNASFTGTISGTTLTTTGLIGFPVNGAEVTGSGVTAGTVVVARLSSTTFQISPSQTVASPTAMTTILSTNVPYFAYAKTTNSIQACWNSSDCATGAGIPMTVDCTGTCTATSYPYVTQFSSLYPLGATGKPDYIQAGGSVAADSTTRIQFNQAYWRSTKMIPPWNYGTVSAGAQISYPFNIQGHGPVSLGTSNPSERDDIGPEPEWPAKHFYLQDANSTQTLRTVALIGGQVPIFIRSHTTFTIPVINNTTYSGMPAKNTNWVWRGESGSTVGFTAPTNTNVLIPLFNSITFDHFPELWYYALLVFGEPQFNDDGVSWGSHAIETHVGQTGLTTIVNGATNAIAGFNGSGVGLRDATIPSGGTHYYGMFLNNSSGLRGTAWAARSGGLAAAIAGGYEPAAASTRSYFNDNVAATYAGYMAYIAALPSFAQNNGLWYEPQSTDSWGAIWQKSYLGMSAAYTAATTENADAVSFISHLAKYHKFLHDNFGVWAMPYYYGQDRTGATNTPAGNSQTNPYITSALGFVIGGAGSASTWSVTWTNGSPTFTMTTPGSTNNYVPTNGDHVMFYSNGTVPSALTGFTTYYMRDAGVGGTYKFGIEASPGSGAITQTDSSAGAKEFGIGPLFHTPGNIAGTNGIGAGIASSNVGVLRWIQAAGGTVDATTLADEVANLQSISGYAAAWNADPKYTFCPTYTSSC